MLLGERIKELREQHGVLQRQLAALLGRKEYNEAYAESKKIMYAGLLGGVTVSALLILLAGAYTGLYRVDDSVKELGKTLLIVFAQIGRAHV